MAVGAEHGLNAAVGPHADQGGFEESSPRSERAGKPRRRNPRGLDIARNPDPAQAAGRALAPARGKAAVIGKLEGARENAREVTAVVGRPDRRLVGHCRGRDEITTADLGPVEPELARRPIGEPLQHVAGLGPPGAAIGIGRQRVGEDAAAHFHALSTPNNRERLLRK